jgi:hypothetical protein
MVMPSPFPHHGPLAAEQVHGRDGLLDELTERLTARRPTVLVAPRRFGKTSVLGAVADRIAEQATVIRVDLYELRSWVDFAARLADALAGVEGSGRSRLDHLAAGLEINLGVLKANVVRMPKDGADMTVDQLLDLMIAHADRHPTAVFFDEFSSIVRVDGAAGLLRTKLQHHLQDLGLVFAGSEPSTMRMLFTEVDQPFYAQADLVEVPPLSLAALTEIVERGFDGHPPTGLAANIHGFTHGHPQRSMQLADAAWAAPDDDVDGLDAWSSALERCRAATADGHEIRFAGLSPADQAVMRLAANGGALFGAGAERLDLSRSSAQLGRRRLIDRGQLVRNDSGVAIVDPLYADWIRHRFPL